MVSGTALLRQSPNNRNHVLGLRLSASLVRSLRGFGHRSCHEVFRCLQLECGPQKKNPIPGLKFFVRTGVNNTEPIALDAYDTGTCARPKLQLANEFTCGNGVGGNCAPIQMSFAQQRWQAGELGRPRGRRLC